MMMRVMMGVMMRVMMGVMMRVMMGVMMRVMPIEIMRVREVARYCRSVMWISISRRTVGVIEPALFLTLSSYELSYSPLYSCDNSAGGGMGEVCALRRMYKRLAT